jgi:regulation of enolase protein 1 (concanavalin A-like superfamily)
MKLAHYAMLVVVAGSIGCRDRQKALPAVSEPEPDLAGWTKIDPDGNCGFRATATTLSMVIPGFDKDLSIERNRMNAPRLVRNVSGDFSAVIRVRGSFQPSFLKTAQDRQSFLGAGLFMAMDDRTYVRLERAAMFRDGRVSHYVNWELRLNGAWAKSGNTAQAPLNDTDTFLRLSRRGADLYAEFSQNGSDWRALEAFRANLPAQVQIGVAAVTTGMGAFTPEFDSFSLESIR